MRRLLIALALVGLGCGDDASPPPIAGTAWVSSVSQHCGVAIVFEDAEAYRWLYTCSVPDGKATVYVEDGMYVVSGDRITLIARAASCPTATGRTDRFTVDIRPGSGELTFGGQSFVKIAPGAGDLTDANTGCFDTAGAFAPMPVAPL